MAVIVFIILGIIQMGVFAFLMYQDASKGASGSKVYLEKLSGELEQRTVLLQRLETALGGLVEAKLLRDKADEFTNLQDSLKTERGRLTITNAEVETVETRLRELEEIERELEASGIETKEELTILRRKHEDLKTKNANLHSQIEQSAQQLDQVLSQIELTAQMKEQVDMMKAQLVQSEEKIDNLLVQIEQGNDQYFILKKRYDALDIEYAQLYEKFSAVDNAKA
jgi:chromosome segregation ATPase